MCDFDDVCNERIWAWVMRERGKKGKHFGQKTFGVLKYSIVFFKLAKSAFSWKEIIIIKDKDCVRW